MAAAEASSPEAVPSPVDAVDRSTPEPLDPDMAAARLANVDTPEKGAADSQLPAIVVPVTTGQDLSDKIIELRKQQSAYVAERKKVSRELRNAERKRRRLKERARGLSERDLAHLIALRSSELLEKPTRATEAAGMEPAAHSDRPKKRASASSLKSESSKKKP